MGSRGTVVFDGFFHNLYLLRGEPSLQTGIAGKYLPAGYVVDGARPGHTYVMISGYSIDHVYVGSRRTNKVERATYDPRDMSEVVRFVKFGILREYAGLYKLNQVKACCIAYHYKID